MAQTKETSEDLGKRVVAHQAGKGYKTISKEFGLYKSTVRQTVYKWRKFKTMSTNKDHSKSKMCNSPAQPETNTKDLIKFNLIPLLFRKTHLGRRCFAIEYEHNKYTVLMF